ncbi:MAG: hypothetical protein NTY02_08905 [Acidobacteria bacterium]|nr:hypothetical protein [Acidobacteriota bacterium]
MRRLALLLAAGSMIVATAVTPARAQQPQAAADAPSTLSLTVRVTPANAWKVVGDLRQLMNEGASSPAGPNLLRDLAGVISATIALDSGAVSQAPSTGIGVSSEPLARALRERGAGAAWDAWTSERRRIGGQAAGSGLSLEQTVTRATKALETHAAKARQGVDALASGLTALRETWVAHSK